MKRFTKGLCLLLALILLVCDSGIATYAAGEDGSSQSAAMSLTVGKTKTVKFFKDESSTYFNVTVTEVGRLRIEINGKDTGCGAKVELSRPGTEWLDWKQVQNVKYNKSKKKFSGKMTSEYILPKGIYLVKVTPDKTLKKATKYSIKASIVEAGYDDVEPNSPEENAQPMDISSKGGVKTYKMLLSYLGLPDQTDLMDCFTFDLKSKKKFHLVFKTKETLSDMNVVICKKEADDIKVIQTYELKGKTIDKKVELQKGTYFIKVWYYGGQSMQIPYTISGSVN